MFKKTSKKGMESGWETWMTVLVSYLCYPVSLIEPSFESAQTSYISGVFSKWNSTVQLSLNSANSGKLINH